MPRIIDLFCGIGGLTNGLQQAGLDVVAGIDIDGSCQFAYEHNNNSQFIQKSIKDIDANELNGLFGENDIRILVGCAPCQPFSNHQKKKYDRKQHKDWGLLYDFLRLVRDTTPTIVSMENVPSLRNEQVFNDFVFGLQELGYHVNYKVHNTENYGMAQRRNRLLLLASNLGEIEFANDDEPSLTVRDVIGHLPEIEAGQSSEYDKYHSSANLSELNLRRIRNSVQGGTWEDWPEELLPNCYKKESGKSYKTVYGRISYNGIAPTLTTQFHAYGTGRFGHPVQDRALSIREGALLQSFPENYQFVELDEQIKIGVLSRQIGNAVPPRLGVHIGRSIISHLNNFDILIEE